MAPRKIFRHFLHANLFMFILLIKAARAISPFLKKSLMQINSKLNEKNRLITYTNCFKPMNYSVRNICYLPAGRSVW